MLSCATTQESLPTKLSDLIPLEKIDNAQKATYALASIQYYRYHLLNETKQIATEDQKLQFEEVDKTFRETWDVANSGIERWYLMGESISPLFTSSYRQLLELAFKLKQVRDNVYATANSR